MNICPNSVPNSQEAIRCFGDAMYSATMTDDVVGALSSFVDRTPSGNIGTALAAFIGLFPKYHFQRIVHDRINQRLEGKDSVRGLWRTRVYMRQTRERAADPIAVITEASAVDGQFYALYVRYRKGVASLVSDGLWWKRDFRSIAARISILTSYVWAVRGVVMHFDGTFNSDGSPMEIFLAIGAHRVQIYYAPRDFYEFKGGTR